MFIQRIVFVAAALVVVPAAFGAASDQLPEFMQGKFQLTTSEGFTDYMYEIGVGWFKRSIACSLYPTQEITQDAEGRVTLNTYTTFQSTYTDFNLGEPWTENTADGREVTTVTTVDGNKLIKVQTPKEGSDYNLVRREVREYVNGGNTMNLILTIDGKPEIKSVRVYERLEV